MKKYLILITALLMADGLFAASTLNVINATLNYTLYFNTIAKPASCWPEFREVDPGGVSGYCVLGPSNAIAFSNYTQLDMHYPGIKVSRRNTATSPSAPIATLALADAYLTAFSADWAYVIYKIEHNVTGHTEGAYLGFGDYYGTCHDLPDAWGTYGTTATESFTSFSIGGDRYFVVGEY